ncbi:MAG: CidA/LrgA family protein [Geminicoccaceae bacterium]|nr:MAG: CidA/LrgA family protein [Geminicoccaceae bacterium]
MLHAFTLLLLCQLVGEVVVRALGVPVPGPVLGMVLLFVGLCIKGSVPPALDEVGGTLLRHLSLLFVPAGVGVISYLALIEAELLPLALAVVPGTLIALVVTGWAMSWLTRRQPEDEQR